MIWLLLAPLSVLISVLAEQRRIQRYAHAAAAAVFVFLGLWLLDDIGTRLFGGGEVGLLKWVFLAIALGLLGELLILVGRGEVALHLIPTAALAYALGLDVLRPDQYAYLPAAIIGGMVLLVGLRAFLALRMGGVAHPLLLGAHTLAMLILVYAALYKLIDRGWALPWAYAVSAGALLYAAAHLWLGWAELRGRARVPAWAVSTAYLGGQALMVVAAFFHYRSFL